MRVAMGRYRKVRFLDWTLAPDEELRDGNTFAEEGVAFFLGISLRFWENLRTEECLLERTNNSP